MRCSVLSLRRCYLLDHHIGAECTSSCGHLIQPSNSNSTSHKLQTDAARIDKIKSMLCVFLALISLANVSMRCSVLSLRRCYLLDHHIGAECTSSWRHLIQPSNSNSTSHKLQTDAARIDKIKSMLCVFLALISLARCQHAVLSSIIETLRLWLHIGPME